MADSTLTMRFEIPRGELERARAAAPAASSARAFEGMDTGHLRGRVEFEVRAPFAPDPVLDFLVKKGGVEAHPPHRVRLDQPVAHVVGQFAALTVLAAHGEGPLQFALGGGRGALGLDREGEDLAVSFPLAQYAGVAVLPTRDVALAAARACRALDALVRKEAPELSGWPFLTFLGREAAILESIGQSRSEGSKGPAQDPLELASLLDGDPGGVAAASRTAEGAGAHVVPLWSVKPVEKKARELLFEPMRLTRATHARGALARFLFPGGERLLAATLASSPELEAAVGNHLRRSAPFRLDLAPGAMRVEPGGGEEPRLPVA